MAKTTGPTIRIGGKEYDVNRDLDWRELMTVEELSGVPLGRDDAFECMAVIGALVFVIQKRTDESLRWETFLNGSLQDFAGEDEEGKPGDEDEPVAKPRPTKPSA